MRPLDLMQDLLMNSPLRATTLWVLLAACCTPAPAHHGDAAHEDIVDDPDSGRPVDSITLCSCTARTADFVSD
jgi:hypothetical protein